MLSGSTAFMTSLERGASHFYHLSDDLIAVGVYFTTEQDAEWVTDAINMPQWFPTEVTTRCLG
jgi:hypothetical protein